MIRIKTCSSQALLQLKLWCEQNINIEVSVNISSHHLHSESFCFELAEALAKHPSVSSECLQLEILESSALGDINTISDIIETCRSTLGVKVALDDFGTGYSSLMFIVLKITLYETPKRPTLYPCLY